MCPDFWDNHCCTFADGFEKQQVFLRQMKKQVFPFANLLARDLTIGDVAIAQQSERTTSSARLSTNGAQETFIAIDGHRLLSRLDIVQVNLILCSLLHQFA